jgi:hypothetical protein
MQMFNLDKADLRPVLKAWSIIFGALFMPGIFSRLVYDPSGSKDAISPFFADMNVTLVILVFMLFAVPVLWFLDTGFGVLPSKTQCYLLVLLLAVCSYLAGYIAFGAPLTAAVLFTLVMLTITIVVVKRYAWYLDDLMIFSFISKK